MKRYFEWLVPILRYIRLRCEVSACQRSGKRSGKRAHLEHFDNDSAYFSTRFFSTGTRGSRFFWIVSHRIRLFTPK
jgi:hypothetical protein